MPGIGAWMLVALRYAADALLLASMVSSDLGPLEDGLDACVLAGRAAFVLAASPWIRARARAALLCGGLTACPRDDRRVRPRQAPFVVEKTVIFSGH